MVKLADNKATPTPGPMVVLGGADGRGWDVETRENDNRVAMLVGRFNSRGDAKLFAAATELLATLQELVFRFEHMDDPADIEAIDAARAAIAKARG